MAHPPGLRAAGTTDAGTRPCAADTRSVMARLPRMFRRGGVITAGVATLLAGVGVGTANNASAAAGCRVTYAIGSQWSGGFTANVSVTNLGGPVSGWRLGWTFANGQRVTQAWN